MLENGWSAVAAEETFNASFCSQEVWELEKAYFIEHLKETVGSGGIYESELLNQFRIKSASWYQEHVPISRPSSRLAVYSECSKQRYLARYSEGWRDRRKTLVDEQVRLRRWDIERHSTVISSDSKLNPYRIEDRVIVCLRTFDEVIRPYGFEMDSRLSRKRVPIYSKPLGHNAKLCFGYDKTSLETDQNKYAGPGSRFRMGRLELWLAVAMLDGAKKTSKVNEWIYIPYGAFAPGLSAYEEFDSYPELETCLRAKLFVYQLVYESLERALMTALTDGQTVDT